MPQLLGWNDDPLEPMLIIEDLSAARWPPPWDSSLIDAVLEQVTALHASAADLTSFGALHGASVAGWAAVADDPRPFLNLRLASSDWLSRALPKLVEAEATCRTDGLAVTHFDLRSDNICATAAGVKFVDWPEACLGNPALDLGFWLPSLCFEGGPQPDALLANAPDVAALVSGYFAARAGRPKIRDAPNVRRVQRQQLLTSLRWTIRALRLHDL
jgi:thiamine kinase-like enzyme